MKNPKQKTDKDFTSDEINEQQIKLNEIDWARNEQEDEDGEEDWDWEDNERFD